MALHLAIGNQDAHRAGAPVYVPDNLRELNVLLQNAQPHVTFWGTRFVTAGIGAHTSLSLDEIATKVYLAATLRNDANNLQPTERIAGTEIADELYNLYRVTDNQIENANFLTRFFVWLREDCIITRLIYGYYSIRFFVDEGWVRNEFLQYRRANFRQQFGEAALNRASAVGEDKVLATADAIRATLQRA